jgi:NADPH:quinone reductase-like Zn-dependent oxidoreductase
VGDAVFGQVMGGMASHVVADSRTLVTQPANINAVEASTVPTTFLTAYECLVVAAGIRKDTRVLVHAATGPCHLPAMITVDPRFTLVWQPLRLS